MSKYSKPEIRPFIDSPERLEKADWIEYPDCVWDNWSDSSSKIVSKSIKKKRLATIKSDRPQLKETSILREESFGGLLFERNSRFLFQLNKTAFYLLSLILDIGIIRAIEMAVIRFDEDRKLIEKDVNNMILHLLERDVFL